MLDLNQKTNFESLTLEAFKETVRSCEKCDLCQNRTNVVFGSGPIPCNLMIIGEGPGEQEDIQGEPFVGRAGKLLTSILESVGIQRDSDVFIANTVKCRPPNNRTPEQSEIEACKPYLIHQIQLVQPKILLLLGTPSLKTILEESLTITKVRGTWYKAPVNYMDEPLYIMPLFHPSYLLRNSSKEKGKPKWLTWQDMKEVASALQFYKLSD
jgi:uracil-DNA glycosylase family 4